MVLPGRLVLREQTGQGGQWVRTLNDIADDLVSYSGRVAAAEHYGIENFLRRIADEIRGAARDDGNLGIWWCEAYGDVAYEDTSRCNGIFYEHWDGEESECVRRELMLAPKGNE